MCVCVCVCRPPHQTPCGRASCAVLAAADVHRPKGGRGARQARLVAATAQTMPCWGIRMVVVVRAPELVGTVVVQNCQLSVGVGLIDAAASKMLARVLQICHLHARSAHRSAR